MPRFLIVADVPGWAQHRHAIGLQAHAPDGWEVDVEFNGTFGSLSSQQIAAYDVVYYLSIYCAKRHPSAKRFVGLTASHALMFDHLDMNNYQTFGVTNDRHSRLARGMLPQWDGAVCRNQELRTAMAKFNPTAACFPAGVDTDIFYPLPDRKPHDKLVVGWCGNTGGKTNFKGYREITEPLMTRCADHYEFQVKTHAFDSESAVGIDVMREWYQGLDVFLCTSSADGTPNPPFEAAACGCLVLSTDVGCLTDWTDIRERGLLVPAYRNEETAGVTIEAFEALLARADEDREWLTVNAWGLACSIETEYSYKVLAPKILNYVLNGDT